jgi:hypothetical protein
VSIHAFPLKGGFRGENRDLPRVRKNDRFSELFYFRDFWDHAGDPGRPRRLSQDFPVFGVTREYLRPAAYNGFFSSRERVTF